MSLIAHIFARYRRAALALACTAIAGAPVPASAQALQPDQTAQTPQSQPEPPPQPPIQRIMVRGTQRIEAGTVLSYMSVRVGEPYDDRAVDRSLKTLFATGLFADVKIDWDGVTMTVNVVENPIINQVEFEGNDKVSEKDLTKEVQLKPRTVFTRAKVQADVQRIIELYRRNGKFAATVDPQIIQRPQNRVDLIFSMNEGPSTGVARISFIGNKVFDDTTLQGQIATEQSTWWKILASNDNYDPDRLTFDREQLRRFYLKRGYADFEVVTAVAELTPDRRSFYITFTLSEGKLYHFGKVEINSKIKELTPETLRPLVPIQDGSVYNAELIDKSIDALTNAAGTKGYAFAEIHPRIRRDRKNRTVDVIFNADQGPRVYVEKINITGNSRTLDKVIRREFRLAEGDAFNRVLVDRSRTRIKALGFFKDVDIKTSPGSAPDRTVLNVAVTEQSTGQLQLGAGYSSTSSFVGQFSYQQSNLFGRGQFLRASISASSISKEFQLSFTEPYFLDRPLAAGIDLYKTLTNFDQAGYRGDTTAVGFRLGFPTSEFGSVGLRYTWRVDRITPLFNAPIAVRLAAGSAQTSSFGYSYGYNTLDDPIKPRTGFSFGFSQDFAGLGGSLKYLRNEASFITFHPVIWDDLIGSFRLKGGYITGYGGHHVRLNERFFRGGDSFRGFKLAGIGPRDIRTNGQGAIGGDAYVIGTVELRIPDFLPADYGISTSLFSDFGTLGHIDTGVPTCTPVNCIKDNLAFRASAGISIAWKSPFGPVQIDLGVPIVRQSYDKSQIIRFSTATGL
ncbi:MAG: outer membrane protein assembly factor BamA [Deltaproteobacteria bacterium]|nr:outer membrane protein assembly factor BamA [Deltaproteobacteria bacterium]